MAPTRVGKYFHTIETHEDVRTGRRKELFAELDANARIYRAHHAVPKRHLDLVFTFNTKYHSYESVTHLSSNGLYDTRQIMILPLTMLLPWGKIPQLAVIPVIRKPHLRAYK